ncbi:hypothetical protein [Amycolatopsis sp. NBC_01286]|uniref:hypothetical protein n=1 Tax=Amycolatopsis sp. NBC_01286 TaxID=2903560 RepID=UPI002E128BC6|nr:hypothetical protein OG570_42955 [Amycolatopsis sp. NBC_01286]
MSATTDTPPAPSALGTRATLAELAALGEAATGLLTEITEHLAQLDPPAKD